MKNILVTGSLAFDYIMNFEDKFKNHIMPDKIHILNVAFTANKLKKQRGGTAANIAYNLTLLKQKPSIFATAGNDFAEYKNWLSEQRINTEHIIEIENESTASAHIITDLDDNQITAFYGGAMFQNNIPIQDILKKEKPELVIVSANGKDGMVQYCKDCKANSTPYIFDPGQGTPAFSKEELIECIQSATVVVGNDYEIELIQQKTELSLQELRDMCTYLIITLGEKGSIIYHKNEEIKIGIAKPESIQDPTGAGDAFRAGLILGLLNNESPETIGQLAATTASYAIERYGTVNHTFNLEDFTNRYKENFNETITL